MTVISPLALLSAGFFLGMRHATDPDHIVALSTVVSHHRGTRTALAIGALWGLGHTATILAVGGAIIVFGVSIPPRLGLSLEMAVAAMLIALGTLNLVRGSAVAPAHPHPRPPTGYRGLRPLLIGAVHGLAGSAAVALLVLTAIHEAAWALLYLVLFGLGTVLGMMVLTTALSTPLSALSGHGHRFQRAMAVVTGGISLAFGLFLAYRLGISDGLFSASPRWSPT